MPEKPPPTMLWSFAGSRQTLAEEVLSAARYYESKYGHTPDLVRIHQSVIDDQGSPALDGIQVVPSTAMLKSDLHIGVKDDDLLQPEQADQGQ